MVTNAGLATLIVLDLPPLENECVPDCVPEVLITDPPGVSLSLNDVDDNPADNT